MSIKLSDKVYRNTQEQVLKNAEDIEELKAGTILIPDGAVTAPKIAGNAVTTDKLALNAVSTEKIQDEAVTSAKIAPGAVNTSKIQDESIINEKLADDSVTESKIADGAVSYQKLDGDLKQEVNFGISERLKTLNFCPYDVIDLTLVNNDTNFLTKQFYLSEGTYTLKISTTSVGHPNSFQLKDSNNQDLFDESYAETTIKTFTLTTSGYYSISCWNTNGANQFNATIMLNEGSTALPYQPYNGPIIHEKDITPVLLWENATPNVAFAAQTITTIDMSKYKYIVFEYKDVSSTTYKKTKKIEYNIDNGNDFSIGEPLYTGAMTAYARKMKISSSTSIVFNDCYLGSSVDNAFMIPIAIYGTNLL